MASTRRTSPRRAFWALLCAALSFVLLEFALGAAVECHCLSIRDPEYSLKHELLQKRLAEEPGRPLVLVLGSSRVMMGLDAGRVRCSLGGRPAQVFNFGLSGAGPLMQAVALRRLLAEGVRPDLLVLEVLPPTLTQPGTQPVEEEWLDASRLTWEELRFLRSFTADTARATTQWAKGRLLPGLRHQHGLRCALAIDSADPSTRPERCRSPVDAHGWSPYLKDSVSAEERRRLTDFAAAQYESAWGPFRLAPGPSAALRETIILSRREGIPVVLLVMPEGPSFQALYPADVRDGIAGFLEVLRREEGVLLLDGRTGLTEDDFWDGHHLLPRGAAAFTARFQRELTAPLPGSLATR